MNEMDLLTRLRQEVPATAASGPLGTALTVP
jgi:hypothetical protein